MKGTKSFVWVIAAIALALGAPGARAAGGTISFHGAIVTPTCGFEQVPVGSSAPTREAHGGCGRQAATNADSSMYRQVAAGLEQATPSNDRLIEYFASYADARHAQLVTRTYE